MKRIQRFEICAWMIYLGDWVENIIDRAMSDHNLTLTQARVLRLLEFRPGVSPGEVARVINRDESTTTGILKRLESRGLLVRKTSEVDRRQANISLTDEGRRLFRVFHDQLFELPVMRAMEAAPDHDLEVVLSFFRSVANNAGLDDFEGLVRSYSKELARELGPLDGGEEA